MSRGKGSGGRKGGLGGRGGKPEPGPYGLQSEPTQNQHEGARPKCGRPLRTNFRIEDKV